MRKNRDYAYWVGETWATPARPLPSWMSKMRYYGRKLKWAFIRWAIVPNAEGTITVGYRTTRVDGWIF